MNASVTPAQAHRRITQLANYEDGLWDIVLGLAFLSLSVFPVTRAILGRAWNIVLFLALLIALVTALSAVRRRVSAPRLGRVRVRWTPQKTIVIGLLAVTFLATLALVFLTLRFPQRVSGLITAILPSWAGDLFVDALMAAVVVIVFSVMGYVFGVPRLFLYGWLLGLGNLASTALTLYTGVVFNLPLAVASIIILAIGAVLLARFLRKYPADVASEVQG